MKRPIALLLSTLMILSAVSYSDKESDSTETSKKSGEKTKITFLTNRTDLISKVIIKGIGYYNEFYTPYLYMKDKSLQVISTALYTFQGPYGTQWEVICVACLITMLPTLIIFLVLQKHIYSGLTAGAVKG